MIIVTGGAGFIGSNIVKALNARGHKDIIVVDDLEDGHKYKNMVDGDILDYLDKTVFLEKIQAGSTLGYSLQNIKAIFHQGACSTTTEWNGRFMMENNYHYSQVLFHHCQNNKIPFYYASSAAVYGGNQTFKVAPEFEAPLNVYGYSKLLFDNYVRRYLDKLTAPVVGLRYFNVYGPGEDHKGSMASVAFHLNNQLKNQGKIKLFQGCDGYDDGEQRRDFIYVADVAAVNLWLLDNPQVSGIFNVGTGRSEPFNAIAQAVLAWHGKGELEYIPFPAHLQGHYQSFTQADISDLRKAGYTGDFMTVAQGVKAYLDILNNAN